MAQTQREDIENMFIPFITNYKQLVEPKRIHDIIQKIQSDLIGKYLTDDFKFAGLMDGPAYPLGSEVETFLMVISVIQDNYKCLDPIDESVVSFIEKEMTC